MFSEYASRFLAQSQSRISNFVHPADNIDVSHRSTHDKYRRPGQPLRNFSRGYPSHPGNPYQANSYLSNLHFASRFSTAPDAPLFHSALDDFREDDEVERERETADFFALQKSRRVFASTRLEDSSETDLEASNESLDNSRSRNRRIYEEGGRGLGIKSSWVDNRLDARTKGQSKINIEEEDKEKNQGNSQYSTSNNGKSNMEDIGLGSISEGDDVPDQYQAEASSKGSPPAFQDFLSTPSFKETKLPPTNVPNELTGNEPRYMSSTSKMPATVSITSEEAPIHDVFWGSLYLICFGGMFATFFLIYIHTETPKVALGDTIYTTLHASFYLLAVDTVASIFVSLTWLAMLRSFVKPLVYLIMVSVPTVLFSFSVYSFISSYQSPSNHLRVSDQAMRWLSLIPGGLALIWAYTVCKVRHSLNKAIGILEFSSKILAANPGLLIIGFAVLGTIVCWTWLWLAMFTRIFLGGRLSATLTKFTIDTSTWWLGVCFMFMYIWTLSVINGIQRSTTAATVSEWYFHRYIQPSASSREVVSAAFMHATTTLFGTISLITLIALVIRLPLLILPRRFIRIMSILTYSCIPMPITTLINPLTLTYAAIHSQSLFSSARGLSQMTFLAPQIPTTTLTPHSFNTINRRQSPLLPYRLAKLLLHATRLIMAMALGFSGWVATSRKLKITLPEGTGIRGSAYAYLVGLVAGFIGWGVSGAMEGILGGILDASVVCWGSEQGMKNGGTYCLEAAYLFGDSRERNF